MAFIFCLIPWSCVLSMTDVGFKAYWSFPFDVTSIFVITTPVFLTLEIYALDRASFMKTVSSCCSKCRERSGTLGATI